MKSKAKHLLFSTLILTGGGAFLFPVTAHAYMINELNSHGCCLFETSLTELMECCEGHNDNFRVGLTIGSDSHKETYFKSTSVYIRLTPSSLVNARAAGMTTSTNGKTRDRSQPIYLTNLSFII
ncbi:MAG: hypothetical protein JKX97_06545 [Candidatus Lindowbacteria bacterium]|nr:hypothetical protein [Candidatus Lindowbacteria bacterium]